nr:conjugative transposon protein TraM [uncultured Sediminibacterium sp.]
MKKKLIMAGIALPFVLLIIWILGPVFGSKEVVSTQPKGFNTQLPRAQIAKDSVLDKLSFYAHAKMDSVKRMEQINMDPYRNRPVVEDQTDEVTEREISMVQKKMYRPIDDDPYIVHAQKQLVVDAPFVSEAVTKTDPEIEAINATLDKIAALQRPVERVIPSEVLTENKKLVDVLIGEKINETFFGKAVTARSGFFGDGSQAAEPGQGISAIIPYGQVVQPGSTVRVELRNAVQIKDTEVPAGSVLSGIAALNGERLQIQIPSIRVGAQIFAVQLAAFDMDGLEGIYVPGSISRDVIKASADGAVQSIGIGGFDASIKTQAVSAGVGAAKGLLSRKVKAVRVNLPAGYPVLLMRKNSVE